MSENAPNMINPEQREPINIGDHQSSKSRNKQYNIPSTDGTNPLKQEYVPEEIPQPSDLPSNVISLDSRRPNHEAPSIQEAPTPVQDIPKLNPGTLTTEKELAARRRQHEKEVKHQQKAENTKKQQPKEPYERQRVMQAYTELDSEKKMEIEKIVEAEQAAYSFAKRLIKDLLTPEVRYKAAKRVVQEALAAQSNISESTPSLEVNMHASEASSITQTPFAHGAVSSSREISEARKNVAATEPGTPENNHAKRRKKSVESVEQMTVDAARARLAETQQERKEANQLRMRDPNSAGAQAVARYKFAVRKSGVVLKIASVGIALINPLAGGIALAVTGEEVARHNVREAYQEAGEIATEAQLRLETIDNETAGDKITRFESIQRNVKRIQEMEMAESTPERLKRLALYAVGVITPYSFKKTIENVEKASQMPAETWKEKALKAASYVGAAATALNRETRVSAAVERRIGLTRYENAEDMASQGEKLLSSDFVSGEERLAHLERMKLWKEQGLLVHQQHLPEFEQVQKRLEDAVISVQDARVREKAKKDALVEMITRSEKDTAAIKKYQRIMGGVQVIVRAGTLASAILALEAATTTAAHAFEAGNQIAQHADALSIPKNPQLPLDIHGAAQPSVHEGVPSTPQVIPKPLIDQWNKHASTVKEVSYAQGPVEQTAYTDVDPTTGAVSFKGPDSSMIINVPDNPGNKIKGIIEVDLGPSHQLILDPRHLNDTVTIEHADGSREQITKLELSQYIFAGKDAHAKALSAGRLVTWATERKVLGLPSGLDYYSQDPANANNPILDTTISFGKVTHSKAGDIIHYDATFGAGQHGVLGNEVQIPGSTDTDKIPPPPSPKDPLEEIKTDIQNHMGTDHYKVDKVGNEDIVSIDGKKYEVIQLVDPTTGEYRITYLDSAKVVHSYLTQGDSPLDVSYVADTVVQDPSKVSSFASVGHIGSHDVLLVNPEYSIDTDGAGNYILLENKNTPVGYIDATQMTLTSIDNHHTIPLSGHEGNFAISDQDVMRLRVQGGVSGSATQTPAPTEGVTPAPTPTKGVEVTPTPTPTKGIEVTPPPGVKATQTPNTGSPKVGQGTGGNEIVPAIENAAYNYLLGGLRPDTLAGGAALGGLSSLVKRKISRARREGRIHPRDERALRVVENSFTVIYAISALGLSPAGTIIGGRIIAEGVDRASRARSGSRNRPPGAANPNLFVRLRDRWRNGIVPRNPQPLPVPRVPSTNPPGAPMPRNINNVPTPIPSGPNANRTPTPVVPGVNQPGGPNVNRTPNPNPNINGGVPRTPEEIIQDRIDQARDTALAQITDPNLHQEVENLISEIRNGNGDQQRLLNNLTGIRDARMLRSALTIFLRELQNANNPVVPSGPIGSAAPILNVPVPVTPRPNPSSRPGNSVPSPDVFTATLDRENIMGRLGLPEDDPRAAAIESALNAYAFRDYKTQEDIINLIRGNPNLNTPEKIMNELQKALLFGSIQKFVTERDERLELHRGLQILSELNNQSYIDNLSNLRSNSNPNFTDMRAFLAAEINRFNRGPIPQPSNPSGMPSTPSPSSTPARTQTAPPSAAPSAVQAQQPIAATTSTGEPARKGIGGVLDRWFKPKREMEPLEEELLIELPVSPDFVHPIIGKNVAVRSSDHFNNTVKNSRHLGTSYISYDPRRRYGIDGLPGIFVVTESRDRRTVAVGSDVGQAILKRANDEDTPLVRPDAGLYAVFDGMGGHSNGALASQLGADTMNARFDHYINEKHLSEREAFVKAIEDSNREILAFNKANNTDMGSTVTAVLVRDNRAYIGNVGDARTYIFNPDPNIGLKQITTDHKIVQSLYEGGVIKKEEMKTHPMRNQIYRSLGEKKTVEIDIFPPDQEYIKLEPGSQVFLCCDGITDELSDQEIEAIIRKHPGEPQKAIQEMMYEANKRMKPEHGDNITAILIGEQAVIAPPLSNNSVGGPIPVAPITSPAMPTATPSRISSSTGSSAPIPPLSPSSTVEADSLDADLPLSEKIRNDRMTKLKAFMDEALRPLHYSTVDRANQITNIATYYTALLGDPTLQMNNTLNSMLINAYNLVEHIILYNKNLNYEHGNMRQDLLEAYTSANAELHNIAYIQQDYYYPEYRKIREEMLLTLEAHVRDKIRMPDLSPRVTDTDPSASSVISQADIEVAKKTSLAGMTSVDNIKAQGYSEAQANEIADQLRAEGFQVIEGTGPIVLASSTPSVEKTKAKPDVIPSSGAPIEVKDRTKNRVPNKKALSLADKDFAEEK